MLKARIIGLNRVWLAAQVLLWRLAPGEVEQIELRTNSEGLPQMYCTNRKSGGKVKTEPRWLEEVPLTAADGSKVELNVTDRWETMAWPQTRDGGRRVVSAH